jgi:hypothetical protein
MGRRFKVVRSDTGREVDALTIWRETVQRPFIPAVIDWRVECAPDGTERLVIAYRSNWVYETLNCLPPGIEVVWLSGVT